MLDGVRRCPRCSDIWPESAPRCLSCRYGEGEGGPRPSLANILIFSLALAAGLGFVIFHNLRRQREHPPLPSVAPSQAKASEPARPAKVHACTFTSLDIDHVLGDGKLAALDACNLSRARLQLGFDRDGHVVEVSGSAAEAGRRCIESALGVASPSTTEPLMVCQYQLK